MSSKNYNPIYRRPVVKLCWIPQNSAYVLWSSIFTDLRFIADHDVILHGVGDVIYSEHQTCSVLDTGKPRSGPRHHVAGRVFSVDSAHVGLRCKDKWISVSFIVMLKPSFVYWKWTSHCLLKLPDSSQCCSTLLWVRDATVTAVAPQLVTEVFHTVSFCLRTDFTLKWDHYGHCKIINLRCITNTQLKLVS